MNKNAFQKRIDNDANIIKNLSDLVKKNKVSNRSIFGVLNDKMNGGETDIFNCENIRKILLADERGQNNDSIEKSAMVENIISNPYYAENYFDCVENDPSKFKLFSDSYSFISNVLDKKGYPKKSKIEMNAFTNEKNRKDLLADIMHRIKDYIDNSDYCTKLKKNYLSDKASVDDMYTRQIIESPMALEFLFECIENEIQIDRNKVCGIIYDKLRSNNSHLPNPIGMDPKVMRAHIMDEICVNKRIKYIKHLGYPPDLGKMGIARKLSESTTMKDILNDKIMLRAYVKLIEEDKQFLRDTKKIVADEAKLSDKITSDKLIEYLYDKINDYEANIPRRGLMRANKKKTDIDKILEDNPDYADKPSVVDITPMSERELEDLIKNDWGLTHNPTGYIGTVKKSHDLEKISQNAKQDIDWEGIQEYFDLIGIVSETIKEEIVSIISSTFNPNKTDDSAVIPSAAPIAAPSASTPVQPLQPIPVVIAPGPISQTVSTDSTANIMPTADLTPTLVEDVISTEEMMPADSTGDTEPAGRLPSPDGADDTRPAGSPPSPDGVDDTGPVTSSSVAAYSTSYTNSKIVDNDLLAKLMIAYRLGFNNKYDVQLDNYCALSGISQSVCLSIKLAERKEAILGILVSERINDTMIINTILQLKKKAEKAKYDNNYGNKYVRQNLI